MNNALPRMTTPQRETDALARVATPQDSFAIATLVDISLAAHMPSRLRALGGSTARVRKLAQLIRDDEFARFHWSHFWVSESAGRVVAAVACYPPSRLLTSRLSPVRSGVDSLQRIVIDTMPAVRSDAWTIDPIVWRRGHCNPALLRQLLESALDEGQWSGCREAYVELPSSDGDLKRTLSGCGFVPAEWPHRRERGCEYRPVDCFVRPL